LRDPCEFGNVNVLSYLTLQQRQDLTQSAKRFVCIIYSGQMPKVLGLVQEKDKLSEVKQQHGAEQHQGAEQFQGVGQCHGTGQYQGTGL
jgi:hypothetical protein